MTGKLERMSDPYQPPSSKIQQAQQPTLYSVQGIVVATVLGSLAAAVVILYLNYRSLNSQRLAEKTALGGALVYLLLIGTAAFLPDVVLLGGLFIVIQTAVAYFAASRLQGGAIAYHREHGGALHSNLRAAGVGLLTALGILFLFIVLGNVTALLSAA
jgi:hypothetical protein